MKIDKWIELFEIIAQVKGTREGDPIIAAEHDVVYLSLNLDDVAEDSALAVRFKEEFNLSVEYDCWCKYT